MTELRHYGVKGMKWGVTNKGSTPATVTQKKPGGKLKSSGGKNYPASEDAITAARYRQQAKNSRTDSLDNKELQTVINRMQLEQRYFDLKKAESKRSGSKAIKFVKDLIAERGQREIRNILKTKEANRNN